MKRLWISMTLALLLASGCVTTEPTDQPAGTPNIDLTPYREVVLTVYGLSCPLCANNLDGQLAKVDGVEHAAIDLKTGAVIVRLTQGHSVTPAQLTAAVDDAGFTLKGIQPKASDK